jgi:hypothetical protein
MMLFADTGGSLTGLSVADAFIRLLRVIHAAFSATDCHARALGIRAQHADDKRKPRRSGVFNRMSHCLEGLRTASHCA